MTGYPTLKFFKKGSDETEKYRGQRDLDTLAKYVAKQLGQEPEEVSGFDFEISRRFSRACARNRYSRGKRIACFPPLHLKIFTICPFLWYVFLLGAKVEHGKRERKS